MHPDLQALLDDVVDDEEGEDDLGGQEEVVDVLRVLEEADGGDGLVGDHAASGGELEGQSEKEKVKRSRKRSSKGW